METYVETDFFDALIMASQEHTTLEDVFGAFGWGYDDYRREWICVDRDTQAGQDQYRIELQRWEEWHRGEGLMRYFKYTSLSLDECVEISLNIVSSHVSTHKGLHVGAYRAYLENRLVNIGLLLSETRGVIAEAKRRGMYSVPELRDGNLGTFYRYDRDK